VVPIPEKKSYPICPSCKSTDFYVDGYVLHCQPYDAKIGEYGVSKIEWDDDHPIGARCAECDRDVTQLFRSLNVLTFHTVRFKRR
jgi:hypothetical protein